MNDETQGQGSRNGDRSPVLLEIDGTTYDLQETISGLNGIELRDIRRETGYRGLELFTALSEFDLEAWAAMIWCVRRREEPELGFDEVLGGFTLETVRPAEEGAAAANPTG